MNIGIIGSGAYGIALASIAESNNHNVCVWTRREEEKEKLDKKRQSDRLPGFDIPKNIKFTTDLEECVSNSDLVVLVVPAYAFEEVLKKLKGILKTRIPVLIATKGIQQDTCLFLHDVFRKYCSNKYAVISGPTFAADIVKDSAIGMSLGTKYNNVEQVVRKCFENSRTKFRRTKDVVGVEICASVKNVMAIAAGILEGMGVSDSTRALFLTESLNDIKELIHALGGKKNTILSFAGFGDILMTCTSKTSRNFSFGLLIGEGASQKEVDEYLETHTVEGMYTLKSIHKLVRRKKVKIPIINLIHNVIIGKKDKKEFLKFLIEK